MTIDCVDSLLQEYFGALDGECFVVVYQGSSAATQTRRWVLLYHKFVLKRSCSQGSAFLSSFFFLPYFLFEFFFSFLLPCPFFFPSFFLHSSSSCFFALLSSSSVFRGLAEFAYC